MSINWVKRNHFNGPRLHFTLSGMSGTIIGKAVMTADYIRDYVLINSMPEAKEARISKLYKELEDLLYDAPEEDECTKQEADMYAEMTNLHESITNYLHKVVADNKNSSELST
jgi:hypothetical protein